VKTILRLGLLAAVAVFSFASFAAHVDAGNQPAVTITNLKDIEDATDVRFKADPWQLLGFTRGTYLPGYGVVFTFEMSLTRAESINPFHPTVTPQEVKSLHERKLKQLAILRDAMRDLVVKTASSVTSLPPTEQIVFEAHLLGQSYEDQTGLPWRLTMTANRQQLLDALARHATPAELAALIGERKE